MPREERDEQAFTGLEAAIIFIAFVVVASVFAYVVLGAGMATSQKNQEVLHAALDEAGSALRPGNAVITKLDGGLLRFIEFDP
ncbi:archaellin/type IV pilin N-terminal domain-containing protein [Methanoculleus sp. 10]|uniref:archaellin/type IV pilin N-terminal domain-containing protein n=1 Tax=Methanoculleus sp. 10 TaxID=430615 RepID=UPI0025DBF22C|nr:archaellin/type IV pilin N-terminal domain-containing protein [Methanoculleus sp. 10]